MGSYGIHQLLIRAIHYVSEGCKKTSLFSSLTVLILLQPLLSPQLVLFYPHNSRTLMEFSSAMNTSGIYICESFLWSLSWPGGRPQHWGFSGLSHSAVQAITIIIARGRWDLALHSGKVWNSPGRNGTASKFHTSLGVTANFLYSVFDWKHI